MNQAAYDTLAPIYDEWQASTAPRPFPVTAARKLSGVLAREARRLQSIRAASEAPPAFADLGCGTGTMLAELRDELATWRLAGADESAGMLQVARRKPGAGRIAWARARLDAPLPFATSFDVCGAFYDALNHMPDGDALARTFAAMSAVVRPGGLLVFDVTNLLGFRRWWRGRNEFAGRSWLMRIRLAFDESSRIATADVALAHQRRTDRFQLLERYFDEQEITAALAAAGFEVEKREAWSPFADEVAGKTWWLARRT